MTDETRRLSALFDANILDTAAEPGFDQLVQLACRLFDVPIALVSLIDDERQWFKAQRGMGCSQIPREHAFCAHAIQYDDVFVVPDARADPRFADNPLVTGTPHIGFYAGAQVRSALGYKLGTLCVIDTEPRHGFDDRRQGLLRDLAKLAEDRIRERDRARGLADAPHPAVTGHDDTVVQACPHALIRVDGTGRVRTWNPGAERRFGWSAARLHGCDLPFLHGTAGPVWESLRQRAAAGESVTETRTHAEDAQGRVHTVRVAAAPCPTGRDVAGTVFAVSAEPAEAGLAPGAATHQVHAFVETTQDAVITADVSGRVTSWNQGAEAIFGYTASEAMGRAVSDLMPERFRAAHDAGMERVARTGQSKLSGQKLELVGLHRDGTEFPIELTLTTWTELDTMQFGAVIRDITERRRAEEERQAVVNELKAERDRAEAANQAKTRFLANVSHELRTPLNAVIGFAEILADPRMDSIARENYRGYASDILDSGRHLLTVINDLIDLSKAEAGVIELQVEPLDAGEVLRRVQRMMGDRADRAGQELAVELPAELPPVRADETKLRQILINLAANALKHTPAGGRVTLAATPEAGAVTLAVIDTGAGMHPEDIPRALEPFGQLHDPMNRAVEGTGLGLPIAKQLAESLGGTLEIDSAPQAGTRISVRLPAAAR